MIENILYAFFAILSLSFLVFIHELGHYIVARKQGMRVEAFAIGFGKPIFSWMYQGVRWQICVLPFGGYVRIAGMHKEDGVEPSEIPDGFFGKTPWQRIKVAVAGPLVNIVFAFAVFTILWICGGRDKNFSEYTHKIGWVDPKSALYEKGVRPGDVISKYNGREIQGFKDLLVASLMNDKSVRIEGYKVNYVTGDKNSFDYTLPTYEDSSLGSKDKLHTIGVMSPAQNLIFDQKSVTPVVSSSGIQSKDRLVWVDGEVVFSVKQLSSLVNESTALLSVRRGDEVFLTKVPRVHLDDLQMSAIDKAEISDWQYEAGIKNRIQDLYFIPYSLSPSALVEGRLQFIDELDQVKAFESCERCGHFNPLQEGDQILAIDGSAVKTSYELLNRLQTRRVLVIVDREAQNAKPVLWSKVDESAENFSSSDLAKIVSSIGSQNEVKTAGNLHLLNPMIPQSLVDLPLTSAQKSILDKELVRSKKEIEKIQDPQKRSEMLSEFEKSQKKLGLGLLLKDSQVRYNPAPWTQFKSVLDDTWRTLSGLFSGSINPKYVSGPVGIIHVVHYSWSVGIQEALFWMAVISLNLGIMNLLPIPVLDGGHIMFSLYEIITRRRLSSKAMEKVIIPFVALLIGFFVFVTFQDVIRLIGKFF